MRTGHSPRLQGANGQEGTRQGQSPVRLSGGNTGGDGGATWRRRQGGAALGQGFAILNRGKDSSQRGQQGSRAVPHGGLGAAAPFQAKAGASSPVLAPPRKWPLGARGGLAVFVLWAQ